MDPNSLLGLITICSYLDDSSGLRIRTPLVQSQVRACSIDILEQFTERVQNNSKEGESPVSACSDSRDISQFNV